MTRNARLAAALAALVALVGWAALAGQFWLSVRATGGIGPALWLLARYFTILTNLWVVLGLSLAATGRRLGAPLAAALTLWIVIVGVVYFLLLAPLYHLTGADWWADRGLHMAMPVLTALWWLGFAPKAGLRWRHAAIWLGWPLSYVVYALIRAPFEGVYPYFFIDAGALGYGGVALNSLGLGAGFYLAGLAMVALARRLGRH